MGVDRPIRTRTEMLYDAPYPALADLASAALVLRLGLHPPALPPLRPVVTALAINPEEHTITQSVTAIERIADWKALETFAVYGAWRTDHVTDALTRLVEKAPGRVWHGFHVSAVDDTKVHRSGEHIWGTCTFHEYTARCPNRAPTVRAHNWVVVGALLEDPEQPAWFLPMDGR